MRSMSSRLIVLAAVPLGALVIASCVEPADTGSSKTTIAPLPTSTTIFTVPGIDTNTTTPVIVIGGAGATGATIAGGTIADPSITLAPQATVAPVTAATPTTTATITTVTIAASGQSTYKIVSGDYLGAISKRCSISPTQLAVFNGWTDGKAHAIYPGDTIKLPCTPSTAPTTTVAGSSASSTTVKGSSSATSTTVDPSSGGTYTVVAGDYLSGIAAKTGTTVDAIVKANGWKNSQQAIYPGEKIKLPAKTTG
ncbi:MAG: N-acetylmuramoyl-L-alanine amidase [Ilumatobacteraceae bacterium]|nr:N-acetylmuramoyl-L-alanine amidase [Ilumatobacteraceae bacterium]